MNRKLRFYRRLRSTVLALRTKSSDRIISDYKMLNPMLNDKGVSVSKNNSGKKRNLSIKKIHKYKTSGISNK